MKFIVIIAVVCSLVAFFATPEARGDGSFTTMNEFLGAMYFQTITSDDLPGLLSWSPETDPCPLTVRKAVQLARARITNRFPQEKEWMLNSITLKPVLRTDKWVYCIDFTPDYENSMSIVIALNGWFPNIEEIEEWEETQNNRLQAIDAKASQPDP